VLAIISNIFLFGPFTIYQTNIHEFVIPLLSILRLFFLPALFIMLVFITICLFLPQRFHERYVSLVFALSILLWLQGNLLLWNYGFADGRGLNWNNLLPDWIDATGAVLLLFIIDGTVWFAGLFVAFKFYKRIYKNSSFLSITLFSLQLLYLIFASVQTPEVWKKDYSHPLSPPDAIFEFSSKQNVIHIILDEFQSTIFEEIINEDADRYYTAMEGFIFFKENTGAFPTTGMSLRAIFSEQCYQNDIPIQDFINNADQGKAITDVLYDNGYEVDLVVPFDYYRRGRYTNFYRIAVPYGVTKQQYEQVNAAAMLDLVLFRYAPHFLKETKFKSWLWLSFFNFTKAGKTKNLITELDQKSVAFEGSQHLAHKIFLQDTIDNVSVKRRKPVYKLIHLTTTHFPAVLREDCEPAEHTLPWTWDNIKPQTKCSFDHFIEFLDKLKLIGIYESSFIILHADHGYWKIRNSVDQINLKNSDKLLAGYFPNDKEHFSRIVCSALPLLAIKLPYNNGPLKISSVQTTLTDIPATIGAVLNLPVSFNGQSVFDINPEENRERRFYYYDRAARSEDDFFYRLDEFIITGSPFDKASWRFVSYHSPKRWHQIQKIDLGTHEASRFLHSGWSDYEGSQGGLSFQWALGNAASIRFSLPKNHAVRLTAHVKTLPFTTPQTIIIKVDGNEIGHWELSPISWNWEEPWKWESHSIVIKPGEQRPDIISLIEFIFSQHKEPDEKDERTPAVLFESITIDKHIHTY